MFSAKEAREKANGEMAVNEKEQLIVAESAIKKAVIDGNLHCYCYKWLNPPVIYKLEQLGYSVQNCSDQRDGTFKISW